MEILLSSLYRSIRSGAGDAILPLLKLISLATIGLILAYPRTKFVPKSTFKVLSKLVFVLLLPCLIFTHLGPYISLKNLVLWWFIPVNVLISTAIGCGLGFLVAVICRPPPEYFRLTVIMTGFGNTGNLPVSIIASVCHNTQNPFGADCYGNGVAYVAFSQWVSFILVCTLVYHMMEPPFEYFEVVEEQTEIEEVRDIENENIANPNDVSRSLLIEAEWPGIEDKETEHCKTPIVARLFRGDSDSVVRKIRIVAEKTPIRNILQPPLVVSLLSVIIGTIPLLKSIFYGEDAPLEFITDSIDMMADAMVPSTMLILGGMIAEGYNESRLGIRTMIGIIVARLLILPLIGIGVVILADKFELLVEGDELFKFVILLQFTTPSAILFGAIASLRGYGVCEASALLFWQHVCAVFSISFFIAVYLQLLFAYW